MATKALNPFTDIDYLAAISKAFGNKAADVVPSMSGVKLANPQAGFSVVTGNPVAPKAKTVSTPTGNQPNSAPVTDPSGGGGAYDPAAAARAADVARAATLRGDIKGRQGALLDAYNLLFGDVDNLVRSRSADVERDAGENISKLTDSYTKAIPGIESSYAALGAGDSTDTRDAKIGAKAGFDEGVKTVGKNKDSDLAKIGSYAAETKGKYNADRDSLLRLISRVDETDDVGDLNDARNSVEDKLGTLGAERATLNTDEGARGTLSQITADGGRFDSVKAALDGVIASSLSGGVKSAAVQAIADASDLSPEDKEKVKLQYGNVYNAPVA